MGYRLGNVDGRAVLVEGGQYFDLEAATGGGFSSDPMAALSRTCELAQVALGDSQPVGEVAGATFGPPAPRPSKVFGIGLNYLAHAAESNLEVPDSPVVFTKFPSCLTGATGEVELRGDRCSWEAELVVVIGDGGRDIGEEQAWDHVAGLTVGQDISDRLIQMQAKPPQFNLGKSFDGFGPIGPVIVSPDQFDDPNDLHMTCTVSGTPRQDTSTSDLIFSVAKLIAYLSWVTTLEPGDLIFTGTPSGVASPESGFLRAGDEIRTTIEGIGTLTNRCTSDDS